MHKYKLHELLQYPVFASEQDIPSEITETIEEICHFLDNIDNRFIIPYQYILKYYKKKIPVHYDAALDMRYVVENEKKLYFKRGLSKEEVLGWYNGTCGIEQDPLSPHRYLTSNLHMIGTIPSETGSLTGDFTVNKGDVVVDLGTSEGNFAISVVDLASKLYLFECDTEWVRALEATFRDYNDKVTIVTKYVSNVDEGDNISLDTYFGSDAVVNFIKADIEGSELKALYGMENLLRRNTDIRAAICTYHKPFDAVIFEEFFRLMGFKVEFAPKYMYIPKIPFFRKGVLQATKSS